MNKRGFTLIELLTVIAIIGILTTVVTISTSKARMTARDAKRKADLNSVSTALEMYYAQQRSYIGTSDYGGSWAPIGVLQAKLSNFISNIPTDPKNSESFVYKYCSTSDGKTYALDVALEGGDTITNSSFQGDEGGSGCSISLNSFFTGTYTDSSDSKVHYRLTSK